MNWVGIAGISRYKAQLLPLSTRCCHPSLSLVWQAGTKNFCDMQILLLTGGQIYPKSQFDRKGNLNLSVARKSTVIAKGGKNRENWPDLYNFVILRNVIGANCFDLVWCQI